MQESENAPIGIAERLLSFVSSEKELEFAKGIIDLNFLGDNIEIMEIIELVQNDTDPRLIFNLVQGGSPINISGAIVRLKLREESATETYLNEEMSIEDAENGKVYYDWGDDDLEDAGTYYGEVEITFTSGRIQTCKDLFQIKVREEL